MRLSCISSLALILLLAGCHSTPVKNPATGEKAKDAGATSASAVAGTAASAGASSVPTPETEAKWLADYVWARQHESEAPEKACHTFEDLAKADAFPPHVLAGLRAIEACGKASGRPDEFDFEPSYDRRQFPRWLQGLALDIFLRDAQLRADSAAEIGLAIEKSKQRLSQTEKVAWMNLAIMRAEESGQLILLPVLKSRLYELAPRFNPQPSEKQYLAVASDFRIARQFGKALEYYNKALKRSGLDRSGKISAMKGIRLVYKNSRQNEAHLKASARLTKFLALEVKKNPKDRAALKAYHDAVVYLGRAQWTLGQTQQARKTFESLIKKVRGKISLAELYWLKGRMAEEAGDYNKVSENLNLALKEKLSDPDFRDKVMWFSAWNERQQNHLSRAADIMKQLDEQTQNEFTRLRDLFWLGKTLQKKASKGDENESREVFERVVKLDPIGYYGLLAHRELGLPIALHQTEPPRNPSQVTPSSPPSPQVATDATVEGENSSNSESFELKMIPTELEGAKPQLSSSSSPSSNSSSQALAPELEPEAETADAPSDFDAKLADWLVKLDESDALISYLNQISTAFEKSTHQNDSAWALILQYYAKAGAYNRLLDKVAILKPDIRQGLFEAHPELLFPQPWKQEVADASAKFGAEPEWIYSIIRQESGFDPHARSGADAFGLMQLLPEIAEQLRVKYNIKYSEMDDLYDPKTNIEMGAAHFKELMNRHQHRFILAVASYNASDKVIKTWMKTRFKGDALEFIEEIPYEETRSYVRLVFRNLVFYRLLDSGSDSIQIPDGPLNLG